MTEQKDPDLRDPLSELLQETVPGTIVVNYHLVVEVVSPDAAEPWLRVLQTPSSTPWAQVALARAGTQLAEARMMQGWMGG